MMEEVEEGEEKGVKEYEDPQQRLHKEEPAPNSFHGKELVHTCPRLYTAVPVSLSIRIRSRRPAGENIWTLKS